MDFDRDISRILGDIGVERERQLQQWSREHDDTHGQGELANAAAMLAATTSAQYPEQPYWAWDLRRKLAGRRQQLVVAAALLVAEIERLDREGT